MAMDALSKQVTFGSTGGIAPYLFGSQGYPLGEGTSDPGDPLPQRPTEPDATDCCGEGCARCVFDIHEEALERYEAALAAWHLRHP